MSRIKKAAKILAPIFKEQKWEWAFIGKESGIPTEQDIIDTFKYLKKEMKKYKSKCMATGRLSVCKEEKNYYTYSLQF